MCLNESQIAWLTSTHVKVIVVDECESEETKHERARSVQSSNTHWEVGCILKVEGFFRNSRASKDHPEGTSCNRKTTQFIKVNHPVSILIIQCISTDADLWMYIVMTRYYFHQAPPNQCIRFLCEEDTMGDTCMKDRNGHMHITIDWYF